MQVNKLQTAVDVKDKHGWFYSFLTSLLQKQQNTINISLIVIDNFLPLCLIFGAKTLNN